MLCYKAPLWPPTDTSGWVSTLFLLTTQQRHNSSSSNMNGRQQIDYPVSYDVALYLLNLFSHISIYFLCWITLDKIVYLCFCCSTIAALKPTGCDWVLWLDSLYGRTDLSIIQTLFPGWVTRPTQIPKALVIIYIFRIYIYIYLVRGQKLQRLSSFLLLLFSSSLTSLSLLLDAICSLYFYT